MLVAAAVCPHPPLLVPAVAAGAADELADLRGACLEAVRRLLASGPDRIVVAGAGPESREWDEGAGGNLAAFGVPVSAGGADVVLPLSLTIGAWLLDQVARGLRDRTGDLVARGYLSVADDASPEECARIGANLVTGSDRIALLVMGDGSAKRARTSPGYLDDRAIGVDEAMAAALADPDPDALLSLTPQLADDLWIAGRPAWQLLAGAARTAYLEEPTTTIDATTTYDDAPYGVGYLVVEWRLSRGS